MKKATKATTLAAIFASIVSAGTSSARADDTIYYRPGELYIQACAQGGLDAPNGNRASFRFEVYQPKVFDANVLPRLKSDITKDLRAGLNCIQGDKRPGCNDALLQCSPRILEVLSATDVCPLDKNGLAQQQIPIQVNVAVAVSGLSRYFKPIKYSNKTPGSTQFYYAFAQVFPNPSESQIRVLLETVKALGRAEFLNGQVVTALLSLSPANRFSVLTALARETRDFPFTRAGLTRIIKKLVKDGDVSETTRVGNYALNAFKCESGDCGKPPEGCVFDGTFDDKGCGNFKNANGELCVRGAVVPPIVVIEPPIPPIAGCASTDLTDRTGCPTNPNTNNPTVVVVVPNTNNPIDVPGNPNTNNPVVVAPKLPGVDPSILNPIDGTTRISL